ncbi:MAG: hypothetical protein M1827_002867 [Pycnora praestabilis]|nr:MAG: hypothetical protein M1827_002867 [Pycnora praestabilis]
MNTASRSNCQAQTLQVDISRDEYKGLVDHYQGSPEVHASSLPRFFPVTVPLSVGKAANRASGFSGRRQAANSGHEQHTLRSFRDALHDERASHEAIYELYQALPPPRIQLLSLKDIRHLLHRLSVVERKSEASMLRYLGIVDEVKTAGISLTSGEWSSAIAFAGRCFARVSATEVESALYLWKEMESAAGVKGTEVTFNILFDIATKAGKFVLAEMILKEMKARKLEPNRYTHVGLIYQHGIQGDGDGIRRAYRNLIDAGEIVDTVVLNCVIASLVKAGEGPAAEQVYERMKRMDAASTGVKLPSLNWQGSRELGKLLLRAAKASKGNPTNRHEVQKKTTVAPNLRTYQILISYHTVHTGEFERAAQLVDELQFLDIKLHGRIFCILLKGFTIHGGIRYTSWTKARLESLWTAYYKALDEGIENIHLGKWMVIWALRAFGKCAGKERMLEIWEEIKRRWDPGNDELNVVNHVLRELLVE